VEMAGCSVRLRPSADCAFLMGRTRKGSEFTGDSAWDAAAGPGPNVIAAASDTLFATGAV